MWYVRLMEQCGQSMVRPQARHIQKFSKPRRFRRSITCSPRASVSFIAFSSMGANTTFLRAAL